MHRRLLFALIITVPVLFCPAPAAAQETAGSAGTAEAGYEKRVLFAPLEVPSLAPRDDGPALFLPALFRPPVPFLKMDDRYETFIDNVEIQAELEQMEKILLNPYADLGRELTAGIRTEIGAYGEQVRYYEFAGGRFEFSTSAGPYGRPGTWATGYDYESWLGNSNRSTGGN